MEWTSILSNCHMCNKACCLHNRTWKGGGQGTLSITGGRKRHTQGRNIDPRMRKERSGGLGKTLEAHAQVYRICQSAPAMSAGTKRH